MAKKKENEKKPENLEELVAQLNKDFGDGAAMVGNTGISNVESFSSQSLALDLAIGIGGWPVGRVIEIYGPESAGKTSLALQAIASVQSKGGIAVFIDAEHALDRDWASRLGVNMDRLIINQPDYGEQALDFACKAIESGQVDLIVIDSVPALVPKEEIDGNIGDIQIGAMARMMSKAMRRISSIASKNGTTVIFLNQIREKIGVMFGSPEVTPGGKALRFYSSVRVEVRKGGKINDKYNVVKMAPADMNIIGQQIRCKIVKNKVAPPFKMTYVHLMFDKDNQIFGFDPYSEIIEIGVKVGVLEKRGGNHYFNEEKIGKSQAEATEELRNNFKLFSEIKDKVSDILLPKPGEFNLVNEDELNSNLDEQFEE